MKKFIVRHEHILIRLIGYCVSANGVLIIAGTLANQLFGHVNRLNEIIVTLPIFIGLTLIYLGILLQRRKQTAWLVTVPIYSFILGSNISLFLRGEEFAVDNPLTLVRTLLLPLVIVLTLFAFRKSFTVKSDTRNFAVSLRFAALILIITFFYGVAGFLLLDERDFHQELSVSQAIHHTIDQLDLTTEETLTPYSRRGTLFMDSLNIMTTFVLGYIVLSFFQPLRARLTDESANRAIAAELLAKNSHDSEDFFKLWPHDKMYFFDETQSAGIAYHVYRGAALIVSDPFGAPTHFQKLFNAFEDVCEASDWLPAFIHVDDTHIKFYKKNHFSIQKIGEEAIVDCEQFLATTIRNKYFRQINNRFTKQGYSIEVLTPPHNTAIITRLQEVSDDWLRLPGRQERGFMMGHFNEAYMQQCTIIVARDAAGTIQGFLNQIPTFQPIEADLDFIRHTKKALGNINDYLLMAFIAHAQQQGFKTINLGLSPLSGIDTSDTDKKSLIDSTMRFVYANGDRFYSFSGLQRFKSKYEPTWRNRYIAYRGGIPGFTRTLYALNKTLNKLR